MAEAVLTQDDVVRLLTDPSGRARAETAGKIAASFNRGGLTDGERKIAEEIFRLMVRDAEVRVREALAQNLKQNRDVPREVAVALAKDVDSVAEPILKFSDVLTDADLVEIIRTQGSAKQVAIAGRSQVSEGVSAALVDARNEAAVETLVANKGAAISEDSLRKVVDDFGKKESIQAAMVARPKLPMTVAERLMTVVSEKIRADLVKRHDLAPELADGLLISSRERAILGLTSAAEEQDVETLVQHMNRNKRLTPSIVLRAVVMGDMIFFETAMAELAGVTLANARKLIYDQGQLGLQALLGRAKLPAAYYPAIQAAVNVASEMALDGGERDRERYARRMIERVLTQYGDLGVAMAGDDLEYLLRKLDDLPVLSQSLA
ncbi:MAG: DUF2336 domain-containing protein [Alphaproteobacteria bacterium]|nr:DUF2336 domain-containing protein [Alphaproteobacteria bacterium]